MFVAFMVFDCSLIVTQLFPPCYSPVRFHRHKDICLFAFTLPSGHFACFFSLFEEMEAISLVKYGFLISRFPPIFRHLGKFHSVLFVWQSAHSQHGRRQTSKCHHSHLKFGTSRRKATPHVFQIALFLDYFCAASHEACPNVF